LCLLYGMFIHCFLPCFVLCCVAHVHPDIDRFYFGSLDIPSLLGTNNMT
jgi:hypothetical protein